MKTMKNIIMAGLVLLVILLILNLHLRDAERNPSLQCCIANENN